MQLGVLAVFNINYCYFSMLGKGERKRERGVGATSVSFLALTCLIVLTET